MTKLITRDEIVEKYGDDYLAIVKKSGRAGNFDEGVEALQLSLINVMDSLPTGLRDYQISNLLFLISALMQKKGSEEEGNDDE